MIGHPCIEESYSLKIEVQKQFPKAIPKVTEIEGRIPRIADLHIFNDNSFCLGSELRIRSIISENPTLLHFMQSCVQPYLYSISYKMAYGSFPYGDLAHGVDGLIDDYEKLFGVTGKDAVIQVLLALSKRKRDANKLQCPCNCGSRLGRCQFNQKLDLWRKLDSRGWFNKHLQVFRV